MEHTIFKISAQLVTTAMLVLTIRLRQIKLVQEVIIVFKELKYPHHAHKVNSHYQELKT
jgi:hypothetical protein